MTDGNVNVAIQPPPSAPALRVRLELFGADNDFVFFQDMMVRLLTNANGVDWSLSNDGNIAHRTLELDGPVGEVARILALIPKFHPPGSSAKRECDGTTYIFKEYDGNNGVVVTTQIENHKDCGYIPPPSAPPSPEEPPYDRRQHG